MADDEVLSDNDPVPIVLDNSTNSTSASTTTTTTTTTSDQRVRDLLAELDCERQARKAAEDSKSDLQASFNRLKVLAHEAIREKEEAARSVDRTAGDLSEALRLKEEALKEKDSLRSEMESAAQLLVSGTENIFGTLSNFKNFSAGGLLRSQEYTGLPAVAYGVIKLTNEIVEELVKQIDAANTSRDQAREQMEQRYYENSIEVSQREATISGLKEDVSKEGKKIEVLERLVADRDTKISEMDREVTQLRQSIEECDSKLKCLEAKMVSQRPLLIDQLNCISKAYAQIHKITKTTGSPSNDNTTSKRKRKISDKLLRPKSKKVKLSNPEKYLKITSEEIVQNESCSQKRGISRKSLHRKDNGSGGLDTIFTSQVDGGVKTTVGSVPIEEKHDQVQENCQTDVREPHDNGSMTKLPSRSARRKKAKRQWKRELNNSEKKEHIQIQLPSNDISRTSPQHQKLDADKEDEIVPIEVRPGHIRFETIGMIKFRKSVKRMCEPHDNSSMTKLPSRCARRKKAKRQLQREPTNSQKKHIQIPLPASDISKTSPQHQKLDADKEDEIVPIEHNQIQLPANDISRTSPEHQKLDADKEDEIVAIVVRPGHICFESTGTLFQVSSNAKNINSLPSAIHGLIPSFICWEILKERNSRRHKAKAIRAEGIFHKVMNWVYLMNLDKLDPSATHRDTVMLSRLNINSLPSPPKRAKLVRWNPNLLGVTLNVDGASRGNPGKGGGGGCCRDNAGNLLIAFSKYYGICNCLQAEMWALMDGIRLCAKMGISNIGIQSDSSTIVSIITKDQSFPWTFTKDWKDIKMLGINFEIQHIYREGNRVADALANYACDSKTETIYHSDGDLPATAKGAIFDDKTRLPFIRFL